MIVDFILILAAFSCARIKSFRIGKLNISFVCFWMLGSKSSSFEIPIISIAVFSFSSHIFDLCWLFFIYSVVLQIVSVRWHVVLPLYSLHSCQWPYSKFRNLAVLFVRCVYFLFGNFQLSFHDIFFRRFMSTCSLQVTEKCDLRVSLVQTSFLGSLPLSDHFRKSSHQRSNNFSSLWI